MWKIGLLRPGAGKMLLLDISLSAFAYIIFTTSDWMFVAESAFTSKSPWLQNSMEVSVCMKGFVVLTAFTNAFFSCCVVHLIVSNVWRNRSKTWYVCECPRHASITLPSSHSWKDLYDSKNSARVFALNLLNFLSLKLILSDGFVYYSVPPLW